MLPYFNIGTYSVSLINDLNKQIIHKSETKRTNNKNKNFTFKYLYIIVLYTKPI